MKRLFINLLVLIALLSVGVMNFAAVTYAQDEPPALVDPFATGDDDDDDDDDDAPPALTLPPAEEPADEEEPPVEELPPAEEPPAEEAAPAEEPPPPPDHGAAAPASAYTGGSTAKSGPGLAIIGLGSLLGAAALRRRKK